MNAAEEIQKLEYDLESLRTQGKKLEVQIAQARANRRQAVLNARYICDHELKVETLFQDWGIASPKEKEISRQRGFRLWRCQKCWMRVEEYGTRDMHNRFWANQDKDDPILRPL